MSALKDLGNLPTILFNSLLSSSPLWKRDLHTIKPIDLYVFAALHRNTPHYNEALRNIDTVINEGMKLFARDEIGQADFMFFQEPVSTFTVTDLCECLVEISLSRRRALLFCLEMKMQPREVIELAWSDLRGMQLTHLAGEVVRSMPRHIRLNYVFWDTLPNGAAAPLFGLTESALEASRGLGFETLQRLYNRMVMIDAEAELDAFVVDLNTEVSGRLEQ